MIKSVFLGIRTILLLVFVAPFSFGAGYTLDISETTEDEDDRFQTRMLRIEHGNGDVIYVRNKFDAIEIHTSKPSGVSWSPALIRIVFDINENKATVGLWLVYDGFVDYLDLKNATANEIEMAMLDAVYPLLEYRDVSFWEDLYLLGNTAAPAGNCQTELFKSVQSLFGVISAQQSLNRFIHLDTLVQKIHSRVGACATPLIHGPAAQQQ